MSINPEPVTPQRSLFYDLKIKSCCNLRLADRYFN